MGYRSTAAVALSIVTVLTLTTSPGAAAAGTQHWLRYDLAVGGPAVGVEVPTPDQPLRLGGVRLDVSRSTGPALVVVLDDTGKRVAGRFLFTDHSGAEVASGDFCRSTEAHIPPEAVVLWVMPSSAMHPCPLGGSHGPATMGRVYVALS